MVHRFRVSLDEPAFYRITVLGRPGKELAFRLSDLEMQQISSERGEELTILSGQLGDQAALIGVLVQLYNRGFCLVGLERVGSASEPDQQRLNNR